MSSNIKEDLRRVIKNYTDLRLSGNALCDWKSEEHYVFSAIDRINLKYDHWSICRVSNKITPCTKPHSKDGLAYIVFEDGEEVSCNLVISADSLTGIYKQLSSYTMALLIDEGVDDEFYYTYQTALRIVGSYTYYELYEIVNNDDLDSSRLLEKVRESMIIKGVSV